MGRALLFPVFGNYAAVQSNSILAVLVLSWTRFTREVIEAEQAEIARLGEQQVNQARAQQAAAGAFGGSRGAIQEAEIGRNVLQQQARTGAQLRSQGYQQAAQQAQSRV
jgi:hypothetical protein